MAEPAAASPLGDPAIERAVFGGTTHAQGSSLLLNPAALGLASGTHVHVSGALTYDAYTVDRRTVDPASGALGAGPHVSATTWSPGGAIGFYTVRPVVPLSVGVQVSLPPAEQRIPDEDAFAYHTLGGGHRARSWLVVGGAYRWRGLAFGATLHLVETNLELRFARDTALDAGRADAEATGFENPEARETYRIEARTTRLPSRKNTVGVTFGLVARIADGWVLGAAYHMPPGLYTSVETNGTAVVTRAPRDGGGTVRGEAQVRFTLPQRLRVGVRGRITPRLELVAEGMWDQLSTFERYDVRLLDLELQDAGVPERYIRPRGLRDQLAFQVGVEQVDVGERFQLGARVGAQRGATSPGHTSPGQIYPRALTADAGVQIRVASSWTLTLGYGLTWAPPVDTGRGAYDPIALLECIDTGYDIDTPVCRAVREGYALPTASGEYGRLDNVFRASLRWTAP